MFYHWLVFLHVMGIFRFPRIPRCVCQRLLCPAPRAQCGSSPRDAPIIWQFFKVMALSLLVLLFSGIIAGFIGQWWGHAWIWASLILLIAVYGVMSLLGTRLLNEVRQGIGLPSAYGQPPRPEPFSAEELDALLNRSQPTRLALLGFGGIGVIAWLMMFKPF